MASADRPATIERRQFRNHMPEVRVRALTGFDRGQGQLPHRLSEQFRHALRKGAESLASAGLSMQDVVRVTYLLRDADAFPACFPMLRDAFGTARPAQTLHLVDSFDIPEIQIELELVARKDPVAA